MGCTGTLPGVRNQVGASRPRPEVSAVENVMVGQYARMRAGRMAGESAGAHVGSPSATTRRCVVSIMSKLSEAVRSLTSNKANTDVPPGTPVPPPEEGAVPRPDREPMAGFESERDSS
jgi:hypothetical protein